MTRIALCSSLSGDAVCDEDRWLADALARRGQTVHLVDWRAPRTRWREYEVVLVRSCWGYHHRLDEFLSWARTLERDGMTLINPAPLLAWNADKTYLADLEERGVRIVPSHFMTGPERLECILEEHGWDQAVVKPTVSANAYLTWRVSLTDAAKHQERLERALASGHRLMVQPFFPEVVQRGEWSLVFFAGGFSHGVLKRPAAGGFRVQAAFGGVAMRAQAPAFLVREASRIMAALPTLPVYARLDGFLRITEFHLSEVELIDPLLFLETGSETIERLADAIEAALDRSP